MSRLTLLKQRHKAMKRRQAEFARLADEEFDRDKSGGDDGTGLRAR